jgi:GT2 family glycosyltransferase/SAM-dependent methyltransferase
MNDVQHGGPIKFTGERFVPAPAETEVGLEHLHRYLAAAPLCAGKRVLDAASGEGYGSAILAAAGAAVTGVEIDLQTVEAARRRYPATTFVQADAAALPFEDGCFEVVTSFETLEHVAEPTRMLDEFRRVLKPGGLLIVSTPDKTTYNSYLAEPNPFHIHELERHEFRQALSARFRNVTLYGQRVVFGSLLSSPRGSTLGVLRRTEADTINETSAFEGAMYLIGLCSDGDLPPLAETLYEGAIPQNALSSLLGGIDERDQQIRELSSGAAERDQQIRALSESLAQRDQQLRDLSGGMAQREHQIRDLSAVVAERDQQNRELRAQTNSALKALRDELSLAGAASETARRDAKLERERSSERIGRFMDVVNQADEQFQTAENQLRETEERYGRMLAQIRRYVEEFGPAQGSAPGPHTRLITLARDALFSLRHLSGGARAAVRTYLSLSAIRRSGLFSPAFYAAGRKDLARVDPVRHYFNFGLQEGRDPSPFFSASSYLQRYPEVAASRYEALAHFARFGQAAGWTGVPGSAFDLLTQADIESAVAPRHGWKVAEQHAIVPESLSPYDIRPDDAVPREAARGQAFLKAHGLLSPTPDFATAVRTLNALPRATHASGSDHPPSATVVMPVYGQLGYTLAALHALLTHHSKYEFEVIVVDDASPDASGVFLPQIEAIRYIRQADNSGFLKSSNAGASQARGGVLVMLNNDTRVVEGWLDELMDTLLARPAIGLVGSKLFYPDGTLQEAGGIVWNDGTAWNYGRHDDPNRPEYCYARQVDYVSGAAVAVPADLWRALGGFDEHFAPAYCEDSDLAFRVRAAGRETWMQSDSRVIHYEGKTSGTDVAHGAKAYQAVNSEKLFARWRDTLATHRSSGDAPWLERDRAAARRVLIVDATAPTPDQDAGSVTTIKIVQVFQRLGYKIVFAPIDNFLYLPTYIGNLQRVGVECLYAPYVTSLEDYLVAHGQEYDVVHVFRDDIMRKSIEAIRRNCPNALVMFNNMDLNFLRMERQAAVEGSADRLAAARARKATELSTMAQADIIFVPSSYERDLLTKEQLNRPVEIMPYMVDPEPPVVASSEARDVLFLGGFSHPPNVDAVLWFHEEIWPLVVAGCPGARFVVAGANPSPALLALQSERVVVTGRIEDLRPAFETARVFVAPLRYGAGVKGKLYTAMAFGTPIVTTTIGAEGIGLIPEQQALLADTPQAIAAAIIRVFSDPDLERRLREAGPQFIVQNATLDAGVDAMRRVIAEANPTRATP